MTRKRKPCKTSLPRALRVTEIILGICLHRECLVVREFQAPTPGQ